MCNLMQSQSLQIYRGPMFGLTFCFLSFEILNNFLIIQRAFVFILHWTLKIM